MRSSKSPNQRVQDGPKRPWLGRCCESLFSAWETDFANFVFHDFDEAVKNRRSYGSWMLKFSVSISWRVLSMHMLDGLLTNLSLPQRLQADAALKTWSDFLLGRRRHPGRFQQHFLPMGALQHRPEGDVPPNINRYILRTVEATIATSPTTVFVYSKLGKFFIIGFIDVPHPKRWGGTKIHVKEGPLFSPNLTLPMPFKNFLYSRARLAASAGDSMSEFQGQKILDSYTKNLDRAALSKSFEAMKEDVRLFGAEAFRENREKD